MFNFPSNPVEGQLYTPSAGPTYVFHSPAWQQIAGNFPSIRTAEARNRIVNGAMQISQENGNVSVGNGAYPADQWALAYSSGSAISAARTEAAAASNGTNTAISMNVSPADTSIAAGEYALWMSKIEGNNVADLLLGTSFSKQFIIAFSVLLNTVGTYWISMTNGAQTHTFVAPFTIEAGDVGAWRRKYVIIPAGAINSGVWEKNHTAAMNLRICVACGSTYIGSAGMNISGAIFAGPGQANGLSTGNASYLTEVGLYKDPDLTGVAPPWQHPEYTEELRRCQRYFNDIGHGGVYHGLVTSVTSIYLNVNFPKMRTSPAISGVQSNPAYGASATPTTPTSIVFAATGDSSMRITFGHSSTLTGIIAQNSGINLNARL